jgi:hypothetical protein
MVLFVEHMDSALESRKKTESAYIRRLYKDNKLSPRSYALKRRELEKWATKERKEI